MPNMTLDFFNSILLTALLVSNISCLPVDKRFRDLHYAKKYLYKFAYLDSVSDVSEAKMALALKTFQKEVGIEPSGQLDDATISLLRTPRCGNGRRITTTDTRIKRFVPHKLIWPRSTLTWKLEDPYNLLGTYDAYIVRNTLHRAFNEWSEASRNVLQFEETTVSNGTSNFIVLFANGPHNDSLPFDGRGGVVAHGFYPTDGNLHFDASEKWTLNLDDGVNLYQTAVHEIGHLLGLEHSNDYKSVMFPLNRPYDPYYQLGDDDVRGIRFLYAPWTWSYHNNVPKSKVPKIDKKSVFT